MQRKRTRSNQEAWLLEVRLHLIGKATRREAAGNGVATNVLGELQHSALGKRLLTGSGRAETNDAHVLWVVDGSNDSGSQLDLLERLSDVDNVNSVLVTAMHIAHHRLVQIFRSKVDRTGNHSFNVFRLNVENWWDLAHLGVRTQATNKKNRITLDDSKAQNENSRTCIVPEQAPPTD